MPKDKRGRRHHFHKVKNYERKRQSHKLENGMPLVDITNTSPLLSRPFHGTNASGIGIQQPFPDRVTQTDAASTISCRTYSEPDGAHMHPHSTFENMKAEVSHCSLPNWHVYTDDEVIQLSLLQHSPPDPAVVKVSVTVSTDLNWTVAVYGNTVPVSAIMLQKYPVSITSVDALQSVCSELAGVQVCTGNPKPDFISLLEDRGGAIRNKEGGVSAYLDNVGKTVRHQNCDLVCDSGVLQCRVCHRYTATLRALKSKKQFGHDDRLLQDSHTNHRYLQQNELVKRLENVQKAKRAAKRTVVRLRKKLDAIIEQEGIELHEEDSPDIEQLVTSTSEEVVKKYSKTDFQRIFWEQQQRYNKLKDKRNMRWHPLIVRFALNLKYLSSTAYKAMGSFLALPSQRTLQDYTHVMTFGAGTSSDVINRMKSDMSFESTSPSQRKIALIMDEMKVKSGLVFNKHSGKLVGFVDLPSVSEDLESLETALRNEQSKQPPQMAEHMLVFMVREIFKPSFTFPIAQYPTSSLSGERIYPLVWSVIEALEINQLEVNSITCDSLSANRKFFRISQDVAKALEIPFKTTNPYDKDRCVYFFCDVPHLLKTTRNCFSNSFAHSHSRKLTKGGKHISWQHIRDLYEKDKSSPHLGISLCHKLTRQHVYLTSYSKMRVCLAAQVMSATVADALTFDDCDETTETRVFIRLMDEFFDCLNVRNKFEGKHKRKEARQPYCSPNDQRFKWLVQTFLRYLDEWKAEVSALPGLYAKDKSRLLLSKETDEGLHITVRSFCELAPKLLKAGDVTYLLSEVFSQDPLEAYFSRQRHKGGACDNPSVQQFYFSTASLVQQREVYKDLKTMNVQGSSQTLINTPLAKRRRQCKSL